MVAGLFDHVISVPLVMEYEAVLLRQGTAPLPDKAVHAVIDHLSATGVYLKREVAQRLAEIAARKGG